MEVNGMPKSYLIRQCRNKLNSACSIRSTLGDAPGAQVSFKEALINKLNILASINSIHKHQVIKRLSNQILIVHFFCHAQKEDGKCPEDHTIKLKISGDGARMTKLTNYVILSFCILNGSEDVLSARGDFMTNSLMIITLQCNNER